MTLLRSIIETKTNYYGKIFYRLDYSIFYF